jgi:hypothetical protein
VSPESKIKMFVFQTCFKGPGGQIFGLAKLIMLFHYVLNRIFVITFSRNLDIFRAIKRKLNSGWSDDLK